MGVVFSKGGGVFCRVFEIFVTELTEIISVVGFWKSYRAHRSCLYGAYRGYIPPIYGSVGIIVMDCHRNV